ncbi:MAG: hypothetical protein OEM19_06900 [Deltaproteobacteria bacterium]|nr:hypothetical protein [Deltaproteobacteria bacterium]
MSEESEIYSEEIEKQKLYKTYADSLDVRNFIDSHPAGKVLVARATEVILHGRNKLEDIAPHGEAEVSQIFEIQFEIQTARNVLNWLGEAIMAGDESLRQLETTGEM